MGGHVRGIEGRVRILVTGAFGFLGGRLAAALALQPGIDLVLASRRPRVAPWAPHARTVIMPWAASADWSSLCAGVDVVCHLAGMNATDCAANPVEALDVNGVATARLVQSALSSGVRRFVYLSTAHVYGAPLVGRMDESVPPRPVHPYATSHRAAEDVVRAAAAQGQIEGVVVRLSNGWGAPVDPAVECWHLLMNDLCRQAVQTGRIVVRSDGTQRRDLIPLGDVCRALQHLALSPTVDLPDTVVNVGGDWAPTVAEVAHLVADRAAAVTGTMPGVHLGTRSESGAGQPLDYCNDRLRATGFMHDPAQRDLELDRLLRLCVSLTQ